MFMQCSVYRFYFLLNSSLTLKPCCDSVIYPLYWEQLQSQTRRMVEANDVRKSWPHMEASWGCY
jgi:hypothetical protein